VNVDRLIGQLHELADATRAALEPIIHGLLHWPDDRDLGWKPVAIVMPLPYGELEVHAFAETERAAATTVAVVCELYRRR
jgi:hypothetical protein